METNIYTCTRAGRTISEKTMEDGNTVNTKDDNITTTSLTTLYSERPPRLTANGHDFTGEPSASPPDEPYDQCRLPADTSTDEKFKQRINPLRIHLGKRPFVDNSLQYYNPTKKRKLSSNKSCDSSTSVNSVPRVPKLIPKHIERSQFHNASTTDRSVNNERDKPVPRLVPKSQMLQYNKKGKTEKGAQLKEYAQSLGLQPMVKFKCRKCCSMSFKTLAMLKEHQLVCRAQAKEPALSPEAAPCTNETNNGGPSRVTRKVYLCSACGTYYENWNLFLHMREVHNRHICLFCLGMFSKAEKLSAHLTNKHNVKEFNYDSKEDFFNVYSGTLYLMCCACDEICSEKDDFFNHDCNNVKPKPVPVLISKNAVKANSIKNAKISNEISTNGPSSIVKEPLKYISDKKDIVDNKLETVTSSTHRSMDVKPETTCSELAVSDTSITSDILETNSKDTTVDSDTESPDIKQMPSPINQNVYSPESTKHIITNGGDDSIDQSEESDSQVSDEVHEPIKEAVKNCEEPVCPPVEKECGIKLKLSLNNASSPVIINSTVDPTVGQQKAHKPPSRVRRPPKRYEKEKPIEPIVPVKPPSIRMTICDRADSPFVKTTIFENNKETTLETLLNNNLDSVTQACESKQENAVKTTIYDNKLEDTNTLNRVPKLTVKLPKELLDKDSSSDYSSDSDVSDKLTVDEFNTTQEESDKPAEEQDDTHNMDVESVLPDPVLKEDLPPEGTEENIQVDDDNKDIKTEPKTEPEEEEQTPAQPIVEEPSIPVTELSLDKPLDRYPLKDLLKVFLASTLHSCIYCNHVRKIAVNCEQLALHMMSQHRFRATVDSITAEELMPETITARLKTGAPELSSVYINLDSYDSVDKCDDVQYDYIFECFQCYFKTAIHKDLYLHNRKMHQKSILLCVMCKCNFFSYSELICHLCPGTYESEYEIKFRCCLCNVDTIPSQFRLMVHLRKIHHTCDVCLEMCHNQARLSNHVWKHKLHHMCYRCGISYRNKPDITNHLFWKHGTESVLCKKCLQKKWPHVYHFCTPPAIFLCEECSLQFSRAVYLKVHKRFHSGEYPHVCKELDCTEKFVSRKLLGKHIEEHKKKLLLEDYSGDKPLNTLNEMLPDVPKEPIPVIDLVNNTVKEEAGSLDVKVEPGTEKLSKKDKKKKLKDKDALLLDVNLPALNLSESDSSDDSDSGNPPVMKPEKLDELIKDETLKTELPDVNHKDSEAALKDEKIEPLDEKPSDQQVLDIWDNFNKYQAKVEKQKEKTPPLVPIRKHVCESDHDYCLVPTDMNGDDDMFNSDKKKNKKSQKKQRGDLSSSSSSSSDSDSSCSCGSNCSCSSSSGSSSSSSSDSDSSDESGNEKKKSKRMKKILPNRKLSTGSNVDVMGMTETPILIPEKTEPPIAETDLETDESETDEEFYDENPQQIANKVNEEKRNQLMTVPSVGPSDAGSFSGEASPPPTPMCTTPIPTPIVSSNLTPLIPVKKEEKEFKDAIAADIKIKTSSKKKSKKKKRSKSYKKHGPIKINIPKEVITKLEVEAPPPLVPNKITISLQTNTVQIPVAPKLTPTIIEANKSTAQTSIERKRASKRRRVPNKFYGYSSDEEAPQTPITALKPQQPPKLEWRKEDLPSPVSHKPKKEVPSTVLSNRLYNYTETIRLTAPIPDPEPPRILMNSESMESSDSDSSDGEGNLEIYQPNSQSSVPPPPTYLNSGTSSLPYAFQRPAVREAREGESVYCYCRCPYDEVSEMIACDAEGCPIEWFHFECVGIMVPPKGKWYCPECRKNQSFSGYR